MILKGKTQYSCVFIRTVYFNTREYLGFVLALIINVYNIHKLCIFRNISMRVRNVMVLSVYFLRIIRWFLTSLHSDGFIFIVMLVEEVLY